MPLIDNLFNLFRYKRTKHQRTGSPRLRALNQFRALRFEPLEERTVLSVDFSQFKNLANALTDFQTGIDQQVLITNLPLIGDAVQQAITSDPTHTQFLNPVSDKIKTNTLINGLTQASNQGDFLAAMVAALGTSPTFVGGDPTNVNSKDVEYKIAVSANSGFTTTVKLAKDLGLPGLHMGLSADVTANVSFTYDLTLAFGVANNVFYVRASGNSTHLNTHLTVTLASSSHFVGSVGALQFAADPTSNSILSVDYSSNLVHTGEMLTLTDINNDINNSPNPLNLDLQSTFAMQSDLALKQMSVQFGGSGKVNPKLSADFSLHWSISAGTTLQEVSSITSLDAFNLVVRFDNVGIYLQSGLFGGFIKPLLDNISKFTGPIEKIVDALKTKPLQSLGIDESFLDIFTTFMHLDDDTKNFFKVATDIIDVVNEADKLATSSNNVLIDLGSFQLADVRSPAGGFKGSPSISNADQELHNNAGDFVNSLNQMNSDAGTNKGLTLTLLDDPRRLLNLFVDNSAPVDLFTFKMPQASFGYGQKVVLGTFPIPPFPPLIVEGEFGITGGISITGTLSVGYDTQGLIDLKNTPSNPNAIFGGFYVDTTKPLLDITGYDPVKKVPSSNILQFYVDAGVHLDVTKLISLLGLDTPDWLGDAIDAVGIVYADLDFYAKYGLQGDLAVSLVGTGDHFRLSQLPANICIFNVTGAVNLGGNIGVTYDYGVKNIGHKHDDVNFVTLPKFELFSFNADCGSVNSSGDVGGPPQLAWLDPATGVLRLNVGLAVGNADPTFRKIQPTAIDENYLVTHLSGSPNDASGETVRVEAFGAVEDYKGVKRIVANAGSGDDQIVLDGSVLSPCNLDGGDGNDTLLAGASVATLLGGAGNDNLIGGPQADTIDGGDGDDVIQGGGGDDVISGGGGHNTIAGGDGYVTVRESGDVDFVLASNTLASVGIDDLIRIAALKLTGADSANNFTMSDWGGDATLLGGKSDDNYVINLTGSSSSTYNIQDSSGTNDTVTVNGTPYNDAILVMSGRVTERAEVVAFAGIERLTVNAMDGQDEIDVRSTSAATPVDILGGDGNDLVRVSSSAGNNDFGNLLGINGPLTIDAGAGSFNRLVVSNYAGIESAPILLHNDKNGFMSIQNIAPVPILYKATGGAFMPFSSNPPIPGYDPNQGIIVSGSNTQSDEFDILNTIPNGTTMVKGNGGDDMFIIATGDLDQLPGTLTVDAGAGTNDQIVVHDEGHSRQVDYSLTPTSLTSVNGQFAPSSQAARTFGGVNYDGTAEFLTLNCSQGPNQINVIPSVATQFTVNGNPPGFGDAVGKDYLAVDFHGLTKKHLKYSGPQLGTGQWSFFSYPIMNFTSIEKVKYFPITALASDSGAPGSQPYVTIYDADTGEISDPTTNQPILAYEPNYRLGVSVATGDLNGDGIPEIVTAPGRLHAPVIKVFDILSGKLNYQFTDTAYGARVDGFSVALGDLNGDLAGPGPYNKDGTKDIILAPSRGVSSVHVWTNSSTGNGSLPNGFTYAYAFQPFASSFIGGATIAAGDLNGDKYDEILIGSGSGVRAAVRTFNFKSKAYLGDFAPFAATFRGGVSSLAVADMNGDGKPDIVAGSGQSGKGQLAVFDSRKSVWTYITAYTDPGYNSQVYAALIFNTTDGLFEVYTAQGQDGRGSMIRRYNMSGASPVANYFVFPNSIGGTRLG